MELKESRTGRKLIVTCHGYDIEWEKAEAVEQLDIDEWMSMQVREDGIRYTCPDFDSLALRFENPITSFDFYMIIAQIARTKSILEHLGLDERDILWDADYIYMSLNTRELKFIYLPTERKDKENTMKNLINVMMYALNQADIHDTYMTEFAFYLKQPGAYSAASLVQYITEKEKTIARLLRLNEPISYQMPDMEEPKKKSAENDFEILDFFSSKKKASPKSFEELTTFEEPVIEDEIVEEPIIMEKPASKTSEEDLSLDILIGDYNFLKKSKESPIVQFTDPNPLITSVKKQKKKVEEFDILGFSSKKKDVSDVFATIMRFSTGEEKVIDKDEFILGKSKKIEGFTIDGNPAISRRHALIFKERLKFFIMDLDSVNHTYVNGRKVKMNSEVELLDGDTIQLANEKFEFHIIEIQS